MRASHNIKFPKLARLERSQDELNHDNSNQFRLNSNFEAITKTVTALETRQDGLLAEVLKQVPLPMDYVVGLGVNGLFTYRRWKSGTLDLWGQTVDIVKTFSTATGSLYSELQTIALPSAIIGNVKNVVVTVASASAPCFVTIQSVDPTQLNVRLSTVANSIITLKLNMSIQAEWKE